MPDGTLPLKINESIYAGKMLRTMASAVNSELSTFSSWMVAAFGAAIGLLIANIEKVAPYISPKAVGLATMLFLVAVMVNVVQRYLGAIVAGSIIAGKETESIPAAANLDIRFILVELEQSALWPMRFMVAWSNRRMLAGDFALGGRLVAWIAQIQAWLVVIQMVVLISGAWVIANALKG
jgi:hypothetical protein